MSEALVCARADAPRRLPGSVDRECSVCGLAVMVAPSGVVRLSRVPGLAIVCVPCAGPMIAADPSPQLAPITPEQVGEVIGFLRRN